MLFQLFLTFLFIGTFSFGGGNAMYPLLVQELVTNHHWLTHSQMVDLFAFAQMTPGPVATNAATFVGYKIAGISGSAIATLGVSLPSAIMMILIVRFFVAFQQSEVTQGILFGLRPVVVALILAAGVLITRQSIHDVFGYALVIGSFALSKFYKINPILLILGSGLLGVLVYSL